MKKYKERPNNRLPEETQSLTESGFAGQQSKIISLANETIPAADRQQSTKSESTAKLIPFPENSYNTRVSIEQLSAIWNADEITYSDAELLIIRDWLYTMADVIIEVINSPDFIPPKLLTAKAATGKTKVISLPSTSPESTSTNTPYYKDAKTAS